MKVSPLSLFSLSFLLALCSLSYELVLAQILSATLGGTAFRYSTVIGLFTLSLGFGSMSFSKLRTQNIEDSLRVLFSVEILLTLIGFCSPLFLILLEPIRLASPVAWLFEILFYLPVILIGFLSGLELPLLFSLAASDRNKFRILSADYIGMFCGSLAVPLVLYPFAGPFVASQTVALLNLAAAAWVVVLRAPEQRRKGFVVVGFFSAIALTVLLTESTWNQWMQQWFLS